MNATPRPWPRSDRANGLWDLVARIGDEWVTLAGEMDEEDAAYACQAVNAHDALVEALRETVALVEGMWRAGHPVADTHASWRLERLAEWRTVLKLAGEAGNA